MITFFSPGKKLPVKMDPGFPGQHTTTTVTTTSSTYQRNIRFDPSYIRTIPGMLKCAEVVSLQCTDKKSFDHILFILICSFIHYIIFIYLYVCFFFFFLLNIAYSWQYSDILSYNRIRLKTSAENLIEVLALKSFVEKYDRV